MERLNRKTLEGGVSYPERIIQFGEGNFLRAFIDWMVVEMNDKSDFNSSVAVVQPIEQGMVSMLNEQDGLYTLILKGLINGRPVRERMLIDSISRGINPYTQFEDYLKLAENPDMRFIISNTTEAGIAFDSSDKFFAKPPKTFPGKLAVLLYHRFKTFNGDPSKGFIIMPCELIDRNGDNLRYAIIRYCTMWDLGADFLKWVYEANTFCNTLVDRIVPGFPRDSIKEIRQEIGYDDRLVVEAEPFHLWVVEAPDHVKDEFPADDAALNVLFVPDMTPYRTRKVAILNGAHTLMAPVAYLSGIDTVREAVEHPVIGKFMEETLYREIIPTIDLPEKDMYRFAKKVMERFKNPYIEHALYSILLNTVSKYKTRNLPSLLEYNKRTGKLPDSLVFSLAALMTFYKGKRGSQNIQLQDDTYVLNLFAHQWNACDESPEEVRQLAATVLADKALWGQDLTQIDGLTDKAAGYLSAILEKGMLEAVTELIK
jgi:tagaturonate reductase